MNPVETRTQRQRWEPLAELIIPFTGPLSKGFRRSSKPRDKACPNADADYPGSDRFVPRQMPIASREIQCMSTCPGSSAQS